jgi:hypothetical protein
MQFLADTPECLQKLVLTSEQGGMGIMKETLFMANLVFDCGPFFEPSVQQQNRFAKLQQTYHNARQPNDPLHLLRLSPRMVLSESRRKFLTSIAREALKKHQEQLEQSSHLAQASLLAEIEQVEKKSELQRAKRKLKRRGKKTKQETHCSGEKSRNDGERSCEDNEQSREGDEQSRKDNEQSLEIDKATQQSHKTDQQTEKILKIALMEQKREHLEALQQVQLKAFISSTEAHAAKERAQKLLRDMELATDLLCSAIVEVALGSVVDVVICGLVGQAASSCAGPPGCS